MTNLTVYAESDMTPAEVARLNSLVWREYMKAAQEAFAHNASYWGERIGFTHYIVYTIYRDSDALERSNFARITEDARELFPDADIAIERASHWLVGWVDRLLFPADNLSLAAWCEETLTALSDYLIYDESHFSELEDTERHDALLDCLKDLHGNWLDDSTVADLAYEYGQSDRSYSYQPEVNYEDVESWLAESGLDSITDSELSDEENFVNELTDKVNSLVTRYAPRVFHNIRRIVQEYLRDSAEVAKDFPETEFHGVALWLVSRRLITLPE